MNLDKAKKNVTIYIHLASLMILFQLMNKACNMHFIGGKKYTFSSSYVDVYMILTFNSLCIYKKKQIVNVVEMNKQIRMNH